MNDLILNFYYLFVESAPFLLLGMFVAGVINQLVPKKWIEKTLGSNQSIINAAFIGAPLPLCSCSVIPVAISIRRGGASKASTASFLVSTPETGVDSIGITYALLGPIMAIVRPISAVVSAIVTGFMILLFSDNTKYESTQKKNQQQKTAHSCCSDKQNTQITMISKVKSVFSYGYVTLLKDFMKWLLIGLMFAAIIQTYVPITYLTQYGQGIFAMMLIVIVSIPMYICASASPPIAAGLVNLYIPNSETWNTPIIGLLLAGLSPGAALVFMLTGPATNIATLMVIKNELGKKELMIYLLSVITSALVCGLIVDWLFVYNNWQLDINLAVHHEMVTVLYQGCAMILFGLMGWQVFKRIHNKF
ncbi:MAG: SO_0444 family Cu/Zn efflux transporter [Pseudomonadales bacterium]|nr:SO_0444 family Cu/Zn efflux transporter [Pseudomonadales bacterium]